MIYLRTTPAVYEQARAQMDAARGLPANGQITSFSPAISAPADAQGRVMLGLRNSDLTAHGAQDLLEQLLASGAVEEINESTYLSAMPAVAP